jgi:uncharacterized integral membrane protein
MGNGTEKPQRSWFARNWGWLLAAVLALFLSFIVAIIFMVFALIKNSDAVKLAIATAESSPALIEQVGSLMKTGWFVTGNIEVTPTTGSADLAIPVSGPKGSGTIYAEAHKHAGLWHLELLQYGKDNSNERLDLLPAETTKPSWTQ